MNIRIYHQDYRIAVIVALGLASVLFTTACSSATQKTNSENKPSSSKTMNTKPELNVDDFAKIQTALRSLDNSLATQSKSNESVNPSDTSVSLNTSSMPLSATNTMEMGKGKGMMTMRGKSCMGMMCKMMMKNSSMMGTPPEQNKKELLSSFPSNKSLPGVSGALHLYHVGEQAFFLNHKETLELTNDQYQTLLTIQTEWESTQQSLTQQRSTLEASLWELTALGLPQYDKIKDIISEIEATNSALRLQFITSVGKAVSVLTPSQIAKINSLWMAEQTGEL
ncbi:hypothetical protein [Aliiglaciecola lipolytica]|uniref:Lipoprotein n=1 Tax=Aliiglaciecola lipolytica E3 TaxID=1127673 RepID=K6XYY3_9ALTE|nr:hypothetical protein [Aliiglaciecola lipolytica]GAC16836.1 hypothetical protein GLIP_4225 [Aliiglaciecola lipolytica E3]